MNAQNMFGNCFPHSGPPPARPHLTSRSVGFL